MSEYGRLQWLCRRGTKELDALLTGFLAQRYATADAGAQRGFVRLLEMTDPEIQRLLWARTSAADAEVADVVRRIRHDAGL
jgi:antitoxin CptB